MTEKFYAEKFDDGADAYSELFDELQMRRKSLSRHGVLGSRGDNGSISIEASSTLFEETDPSLLENFGIKPDVIEKSTVTFDFYKQNVEDGIYLASELHDTHVYELTSEVIAPCGTSIIPEQFHEEIRDEIIGYLGGDSIDELDTDERSFVENVMTDSEVCDQVIYQKATVNYSINPLHGNMEYSVSIDYIIAFGDDVWATVSGAIYSTDYPSSRYLEVHHPELDSHEIEHAIHTTSPIEYESLSPGEHILITDTLDVMLDNEEDLAGITAGIPDHEHCRRIQTLLQQIPSF